jgi:hypothetical protein
MFMRRDIGGNMAITTAVGMNMVAKVTARTKKATGTIEQSAGQACAMDNSACAVRPAWPLRFRRCGTLAGSTVE